MPDRWISQSELSDICGFHVKTLQMLVRREPGVLITRRRGKRDEYKLPHCIVNLLARERAAGEREKRSKKPEGDKTMSARKLEAETRVAEIELEELEGNLIQLDVHEKRLDDICGRVASVLDTVPSKYLGRIQIARSELEAQEVGEKIREESKAALYGIADDLEEAS